MQHKQRGCIGFTFSVVPQPQQATWRNSEHESGDDKVELQLEGEALHQTYRIFKPVSEQASKELGTASGACTKTCS